MFDDLKRYFILIHRFRHSNILAQRMIMRKELPELLERSTSDRLKHSIRTFMTENIHYDRASNS